MIILTPELEAHGVVHRPAAEDLRAVPQGVDDREVHRAVLRHPCYLHKVFLLSWHSTVLAKNP